MDGQCLIEIVAAIANRIAANRERLIQLDRQNGDGDLGISMDEGFQATLRYLQQNTEEDLGKVFSKAGDSFNEAAPSSLGTILAFGFKGMARALKGKQAAGLAEMAAAMQAGVDNIMLKAGSKPGEKTIIDALVPGVQALQANAPLGVRAATAAAAAAAAKGSESTRAMRAVWGRAAYYGEQSIGVLDGGSVVGRLIFEGISDWAGPSGA
jgi:dihydroxyacetone kinase-like protein